MTDDPIAAQADHYAMLKFLFPRLTAEPARGALAFAALVKLARNPAYFREGGVADTLDDRFALLATVTALALVRAEGDGASGESLSVALTERFVEVLEAEHRELGMSDPSLGKTMRKLVGALARRVDLWRAAVAGESTWSDATQASLPAAGIRAADLLRADWDRIERTDLDSLAQGVLA